MLPKNKAVIYDPMIIPRVKQYLEENVHQTYVDVGVMARELQERYREYTRRKAVPFRILVEQAYKTVLHSYGLDSNPSSDNDDEVNSDLELMDDEPTTNHMNDTLTNMYMNNKNKGSASNDDELIDISSDEDDDNLNGDKGRSKTSAVSTTTTNLSSDSRSKQGEPISQLSSNQNITVTKIPSKAVEKEKTTEVTNSTAITSNNNNNNTKNTMLITHPALVNNSLNKKQQQTQNSNAATNANSNLSQAAKKRKLESLNSDNITNSSIITTVVAPVTLQTVQTPEANVTSISMAKPTSIKAAATSNNSNSNGNSSNEKPSQKLKKYRKEVYATFVETNFDDVGGMDKILKELCELLLHVKHPEIYRHIGLPPPRGFLLHGPPGSGKTLLAHAIAGQLNIGLIEIPATELVAGVSGESEERIREVFEQATALSPCVLFIDEIDAISANRMNAQKDMERRIVSQLLSSLDALSRHDNGDQVLVIGATNRADALDPALRRVGRFDQEISLGIPDRDARCHILKIICRNLKIEQPFDFDGLAALTPGYVGADLLALATRAASTAIKRIFTSKESEELIKRLQPQHQENIQYVNLMEVDDLMEKNYGDKKDVAEIIDDVVELVDDSLTDNKMNGNYNSDDVVALDDVDDVVNLDDDKVVNLDDDKDDKEKDIEVEVIAEKETAKEKDIEEVVQKETEVVAVIKEAEVKESETASAVEEKDEVELMEEDVPEAQGVLPVDSDADVEMAVDSNVPVEASDKTTDENTKNLNVVEAVVNETVADAAVEAAVEKEKVTTIETAADIALQELIEDKLLETQNIINGVPEDEPIVTMPAEPEDSVIPIKMVPQAKISEVETLPLIAMDVAEKESAAEASKETLCDAVLNKPEMKLTLSLDNMIGWLTANTSPLTETELNNLSISKDDFVDSLKFVLPSAKREGFITVPDVTWDDIGSLNDIREELKLAILAPVKFPQKLKLLGLNSPSGVLLCGPPGCGKTLLAKAVANEAGVNFISVKGPELLNMYVGESERAVRQCFQRARNSTPCVIFFDEFDSLCPKRSDNGEGGAGMRVVNQLLTEMDGIEERKGVFLMAATNRPDIVDPAVLRPGRLDKILYVGLPAEHDRSDILRALTKNGTKPPLDNDVSLTDIARYTEGYTGADLAGLVRQASLQTLKDSILDDVSDNLKVKNSHFLQAFRNIKPSVNDEDKKHYEKLKIKYGAPVVNLQ